MYIIVVVFVFALLKFVSRIGCHSFPDEGTQTTCAILEKRNPEGWSYPLGRAEHPGLNQVISKPD